MHTARPGSSLSLRPTSSSSHIPSSQSRPSSSASLRTTSRISLRPGSRHSQRPPTRQSTRLAPLCQALVANVTGFSPETDEGAFKTALEHVSKSVDQVTKQAVGLDMGTVEKQLKGHAQKARIQSHSNLADALELSSTLLQPAVHRGTDLDQEIKMSKLPDHLQLLIILSSPVAPSSLAYADVLLERVRNRPPPPPTLSWKEILADEPFEGQHWQGAYGMPPGSTVNTWDDEGSSDDSSPPLSPLDDADGLDDALSSTGASEPADPGEGFTSAQGNRSVWEEQLAHSLRHRDELEALQRRQYWREDWRSDAPLHQAFDIGDPSTLGPSFDRIIGDFATLSLVSPTKERHINEHDAVREILMGLQGRFNLMLEEQYDESSEFVSVSASPDAPRLLHLTSSSQKSIVSSFAEMATALFHLRQFTRSMFAQASIAGREQRLSKSLPFTSRTLEAFAEAVDAQVRRFERWCTKREEVILRRQDGNNSNTVISLLNLEKAVRDEFSETYLVLLQILRGTAAGPSLLARSSVFPPAYGELTPSSFASTLLDALFTAIQIRDSMGDVVTTASLMQVFVQSVDPVWSMVGRWLNSGMPTEDARTGHGSVGKVDDEFFIESNDLGLADPDFWTDGYVLRDDQNEEDRDDAAHARHVPVFLEPVSAAVLSAGKSIGLLRALDSSDAFDPWNECSWAASWPSFEAFIKDHSHSAHSDHVNHKLQLIESEDTKTESVGIISSAELSLLVSDRLNPFCQAAGKALKHVLHNECGLWGHLQSIEDLYFMRKGDTMSHFCDVVFARMDSRQTWSDFHFLNTAFRDVVDAERISWIDTSLVRLSYRGNRETVIHRTVRGLEGLSVEYRAPFPLTFIFNPRASQVYNAIFVLLLQVRRAKALLERILVRGSVARGAQMVGELKVFYAMRSRLSWFVNALLNFIATNVLQAELIHFHAALKDANSLDEIIHLHQTHLEKLEGRCLLHQKTSALRRAVLSIMDMSIHFSDCFTAFAGDTTTHDVSRNSIMVTKRHRSKRLRRQRRNVVGFSQSDAEDDSQESDSDHDDALWTLRDDQEPAASFASSVSVIEESFMMKMDKMSAELDGLVRFIRRGVESLASGGGEAAPAFEVFAFALEDWDR